MLLALLLADVEEECVVLRDEVLGEVVEVEVEFEFELEVAVDVDEGDCSPGEVAVLDSVVDDVASPLEDVDSTLAAEAVDPAAAVMALEEVGLVVLTNL